MKALLVACAIFAALPTHARDRIPCPAGITSGMSYHIARGMLIDSGFTPVPFPQPDEAETAIKRFISFGYTELHGVSMGNAFGTYHWSGKGHGFTVVTKFNERDRPPVHHCETTD